MSWKLIPENISNIKNYLDNINHNFESIVQFENEKNKEINELKEKIKEQEKKLNDYAEKIKSKSSSSIWESMQVQLQEKDKMILHRNKLQSLYNNYGQDEEML